jgi:hypothetical protein
MIKHFMYALIQIIVRFCLLISNIFYLCLGLHLIGSNLSIQQTISAINQMFLPQQESLPAGKNKTKNKYFIFFV